MAYVWVFLGTAVGGVARYWCSGLAARLLGSTFPWGTLIVNVSGSMVIGLLATLAAADVGVLARADARLFAIVGICGGYTTVSSFSLQTLSLSMEGEWVRAGLNVIGSVALCLASVSIGHLLGLAFAH